jgi:hypothetical protein
MAATPANSFNQNSTSSGLQNWDGTATPSTTALVQYFVVSGATTNTVNNITPTANTGWVLTSNGLSSQPTFQAIPFTQMPWTDKATSFNAAAGNGYFVTATATATMPASPTQGQIIAFEVDGVGSLLTIQANTGQIIRGGKAVSASAGTCVNNFQGDAIVLVYRAADTSWQSIQMIGTWTIT